LICQIKAVKSRTTCESSAVVLKRCGLAIGRSRTHHHNSGPLVTNFGQFRSRKEPLEPSCGLVIETREPQELPCGRGGPDGGVDLPVPGAPERRKLGNNLSNCRYPVLKEAAAALDWAVTRDRHLVSEEHVLRLKQSQRINHLRGMHCPRHRTMVCTRTRRL
jgi:hypothetical protein